MYAAGRIPGSFFRREGRPSEDAILTCRLIDRPLRPTFIKGLRNEVQVVITVMALNPDHAYDVLAINAASASTQISGLPFNGPVGGTRVALIDGQWVGFPTHSRARAGHLRHGRRRPRARVGGDVAIMMVEAEATENTIELIAGGATQPTEEVVAEGLEAAKPFIAELCRAQAELAAKAAKPTAEFPVFLDYQRRRVRGRRGRGLGRAGRRADHRRQAGARDRARPRSRTTPRRVAAPTSSRAARTRSARPTGR